LLKNNRREEKEEVEELNPRILDRSWVVKNDNVNQQHGQTTTTSSLAPTSAVINNDPVSHSIVSTCVFQCAAGGAGLISTASWVPTIARRDEEGTRHRRRRKETGVETVEYGNITRPASTSLMNIQGKDHCSQDKHHWQSGTFLNRCARLLLRIQRENKSPGKLKYVRQPSFRPRNRKKYVGRLSHPPWRNLKYVPHQIFIMFPDFPWSEVLPHEEVLSHEVISQANADRFINDVIAGGWPPPPKVNNKEICVNVEAESDSEVSSSNGSIDGEEKRQVDGPQPPIGNAILRSSEVVTMPPNNKKKKITAAEESANKEAEFRDLCVKNGVNPDTSSSGESTNESEDQWKDDLDRLPDEEDELDRREKEAAIPETDIHVESKSIAKVEDRDIEGKSGSITSIKTHLQPRSISMPITSIHIKANAQISPVQHVLPSPSLVLLDSSRSESPIPSDQQVYKSPSRPHSGLPWPNLQYLRPEVS
jgi:hypothetical protein